MSEEKNQIPGSEVQQADGQLPQKQEKEKTSDSVGGKEPMEDTNVEKAGIEADQTEEETSAIETKGASKEGAQVEEPISEEEDAALSEERALEETVQMEEGASEERVLEGAVQMEEGTSEEDLTALEGSTAEKAAQKKKWMAGIGIGVVALILILIVCWMNMDSGRQYADKGIAYAKDNNLYLYNLEQDPFLAAEGISSGGQYHQYYSAWGTTFNETGSSLYFTQNVRADGTFDLYYREVSPEAENVLVAEAVVDYLPSADGMQTIYVKSTQDNTSMELYVFDGTQSILAAEDILAEGGAYAISADGTFLMYRKSEDTGTALYVRGTGAQDETVCLHENAAIALMTSESNEVFYAGEEADGTYGAYVYSGGTEAEQIMDQVTYLEVMPNGKAALLMCQSAEEVSYASLVEDDVAESDAALTEADGEAYTQKQDRDVIREAMENGEGISPILQNVYIYSDGMLTEVARDVISAVAVNHEDAYAICYAVEEPEKMQLSELSSLQDVEYGYYMSLLYGTPQILLADANGETWRLEGENVMPADVFLSYDGSLVGYYDMDLMTGDTTLKVAELGKEVLFEMEQVESAGFLGTSHEVAYYRDYENGIGVMGVWNDGQTEEIEGVGGVHFPVDQDAVYYISNIDQESGNGDLCVMQQGETTVIDTEVYSMQYKYNGRLAYLKEYDYSINQGDLYYFDGTESKAIDTDITAIFMY